MNLREAQAASPGLQRELDALFRSGTGDSLAEAWETAIDPKELGALVGILVRKGQAPPGTLLALVGAALATNVDRHIEANAARACAHQLLNAIGQRAGSDADGSDHQLEQCRKAVEAHANAGSDPRAKRLLRQTLVLAEEAAGVERGAFVPGRKRPSHPDSPSQESRLEGIASALLQQLAPGGTDPQACARIRARPELTAERVEAYLLATPLHI